jgi:uncharacterized protein YjbI with pentapeptide repeats
MRSPELEKALEAHYLWRVTHGKEGTRLDLSGAGLSGADLSWADLTGADLSGANLRDAKLSGAVILPWPRETNGRDD